MFFKSLCFNQISIGWWHIRTR